VSYFVLLRGAFCHRPLFTEAAERLAALKKKGRTDGMALTFQANRSRRCRAGSLASSGDQTETNPSD